MVRFLHLLFIKVVPHKTESCKFAASILPLLLRIVNKKRFWNIKFHGFYSWTNLWQYINKRMKGMSGRERRPSRKRSMCSTSKSLKNASGIVVAQQHLFSFIRLRGVGRERRMRRGKRKRTAIGCGHIRYDIYFTEFCIITRMSF